MTLQGRLAAGSCTNPGKARGSEEQSMEALFHFVDPSGNEISPKAVLRCVNTTNGEMNSTLCELLLVLDHRLLGGKSLRGNRHHRRQRVLREHHRRLASR
jgi:hypothetical protein